MPRAASVRYYIDADLLGLAKTLVRLRPDVTYPGDPGGVVHKRQRPPCPVVDPATPDTQWVPEVARRGWLIITRDHRIHELPAERRAVEESAARMVALAGSDARSTWGQLEVVMGSWRRIEGLADSRGPFIIRASRTGWTPLPLDDVPRSRRTGQRVRRDGREDGQLDLEVDRD